MSSENPDAEDQGRFARRLRAKKFLRFLPRRAMMHKYPVVGRFADFARKRAYLWSFRIEDLRPSFYAGSILSLLPVMGLQLPLALILSLVLRGNFMVMGGLQFITNPFTAAPIYYATHQLGAKIIRLSGFGEAFVIPDARPLSDAEAAAEPVPLPDEPTKLERSTVSPQAPRAVHWTRRVGTAVNALVIGGTVAGTLLGVTLDLIWRFTAAHHHRPKSRPPGDDSHSTTTPPATK